MAGPPDEGPDDELLNAMAGFGGGATAPDDGPDDDLLEAMRRYPSGEAVRTRQAATAAAAAAPKLSQAPEEQFWQRVDAISDPEAQSKAIERAGESLKTLRTARKTANKAVGAYGALTPSEAGMAPEAFSADVKRQEAALDTMYADPAEAGQAEASRRLVQGAGQVAKRGVQTLAQVLDIPAEFMVRRPASALFSQDKTLADPVGGQGLVDALRWRDEQTRLGSTDELTARQMAESYLARTVLAVPKLAGGVAGTVIAAPVAGLGALSDIPSMARGEQGSGDVLRNMGQVFGETQRDAADLATKIETDPLSWVSMGLGGSLKTAGQNALSSTMRVAQAAGKDAAAAEALGQKVASVLAETAGTPQAAPRVLAVMEEAGLGQAAKRAWGEDLRFLGRAQASIHPPFLEGRGVEVLPQLTGQEYAGGKVLEGALNPVLKATGARPRGLYDPLREQAQAFQRQARAEALQLEQGGERQLEEGLSALPKAADPNAVLAGEWGPGSRIGDPSVRAEIKRRHIDPDFERSNPSQSLIEQRIPNPARPGEYITGPNSRIVPGGPEGESVLTAKDFVPYEQLDETFGAGARQFTDLVKQFGDKKAKELMAAGVLDEGQLAQSPFSNAYLQRQYSTNRGNFEELVDEAFARKTSAAKPDKARIGAAEGYPGGMSRTELEQLGQGRIKVEDDPLAIVGSYNRTSARATAQAKLEKRFADNFGQPVKMGDESRLVGQAKVVENSAGEKVAVPNDLYNMINGTFDQSMSTISKALKSKGVGATAPGRALVKSFEGIEGLTKRWKGLVLRSPGYHFVNSMDDTAKAFVDGNANLPGWVAKADDLMLKPDAKYAFGGSTKTGGEWLAEAQAQGIAMDAGARFEQAGMPAANKLQEAIPDQAAGPLRRAGRAIEQASPEFGRRWETGAKLGHYLWARSQGAGPAEAASRTFNVLIDWGSKGKMDHVAGWMVPFWKYVSSSPKVLAQGVAKAPGRMSALARVAYGEDQPSDLEPRESVKNRPYAQLRGLTPAANLLRETLGGTALPEGSQFVTVPKLTFGDTYAELSKLNPLAEGGGLRNLPDYVGTKLNPIWQGVSEYGSEHDLLTGQEMQRPTLPDFEMVDGQLKMRAPLFPAGTPPLFGEDPGDLNAAPGQAGWARWFPQFVMSRGEQLAANQAIARSQKGGNPSTLGREYNFKDQEQAGNALANQILGYLFGHNLIEVGPENALENVARSPEVQRLMRTNANAKKARGVAERE